MTAVAVYCGSNAGVPAVGVIPRAGLIAWVHELRAKGFAYDTTLEARAVTSTVTDALAACAPVS